MFGLGFIEILIIFLAVIVFVNPKDLPKLFRKVGRVYRQIMGYRNKLVQYRRHIEKELEEIGQEQQETPEAPGHESELEDAEVQELKNLNHG